MLMVDVIEGVPEREDVGSPLKGREAAITQRPISALELGRNQSATVGAGRAGAAGASQVSVGNAAGHDGGGGAGPRALRTDVVEDAVVAKTGLVDQDGGEDVGLTQGDVACMVSDALVAAEGVRFGKSR